jgi:pyruvate oxidase
MSSNGPVDWHKVAEREELPDGRVKAIVVGRRSLALTRYQGRYGCLDNHCPHQGGPLGEGSIEKGWLRCPWHGYDYNPLDGEPPEGFSDAVPCFRTDERRRDIRRPPPGIDPCPHGVGRNGRDDGELRRWRRLRHGRPFQPRTGRRHAGRRGARRYPLLGHPPRGSGLLAASAYGKLTGRPAACFAIAGPGSTNLLTGLYDAKTDRAPILVLSDQVPSKTRGRGAFQDADLGAAFKDVARYSQTVQAGSDHAEL